MKRREAKKLELWREGHPTRLGVSCLVDDEIPNEMAVPMREHLKDCVACRTTIAHLIRVEFYCHPDR